MNEALAIFGSVTVVALVALVSLRMWLTSRQQTDWHEEMASLRNQFASLAAQVKLDSDEAKATVAQAVSTMNGIAVAAGLRRIPKMEQNSPMEQGKGQG